MPFTDLTKSFSERLKSPFWGAYSFSWVAINWKLLAHALSDQPFQVKLKKAEELLSSDALAYRVGVPLVLAVTGIVGLPWFNWAVSWMTSTPQILQANKQNELALAKFQLDDLKLEKKAKDLEQLQKRVVDAEASLSKKQADLSAELELVADKQKRFADQESELKKRLQEFEERMKAFQQLEKSSQEQLNAKKIQLEDRRRNFSQQELLIFKNLSQREENIRTRELKLKGLVDVKPDPEKAAGEVLANMRKLLPNNLSELSSLQKVDPNVLSKSRNVDGSKKKGEG